ncbi:MAG: NYN domain-containing protein, partial [Bacillota bacterium]|nr:NYN domain-containing protein [Bacillota bacterium]
KSRQLFPCFFGSALKMQGIDEFISALDKYTMDSSAIGATFDENQLIVGDNFKAITFRITRDREDRLTHLKVIEGKMKIRDTVGEEKINQIRIYSGGKYKTVEKAVSGDICVVTGLDKTEARKDSLLQAVMSYSVILPDNVNVHEAYTKLKELEEEDPQLLISWNEKNQEIQIKIMGKVQLEILEELIRNRFGYDVQFGEGRIAYKETIKEPITGAGHFEPLRHYSEVHLLLEPLPRGSGMVFDSVASEDVLDKNWQRLIMTHLMEREHLGTLTASPITDIKITILTGRAHAKHTEGGDFRQSTYRAIRQALRKSLADGNMLLLEPWYAFRLYIPNDMVGRAMSDIQRMGGNFELDAEGNQSNNSDLVCLSGNAPVSKMKDYINEVASYTKGFGQLACEFAGYEECHNQEEVIEAIGYDPDKDVDNPADSVFCSHGAGHVVPWYDADEMMHMDNGYAKAENPDAKGEDSVAFARDGHERGSMARLGQGGSADSEGLDKELERIFNRTFNRDRSEPRIHLEARELPNEIETRKLKMDSEPKTDYLLVDGYNIIFAWQDLKELAAINIDAAREALIDILCNYRGFRSTEIILVFDAYRVKGGKRHIDKVDNITVVYTAEAETADSYIERITYELAGKGKDMSKRKVGMVRVATSDRAEQIIIMGNNAHKLSAKDFKKEIEDVNAEISDFIKNLLRKNSRENPNRLNIPNGNE